MLIPIPAKYRKRRGQPRPPAAPPGPAPLTLISASYSSAEMLLTLTFSRAINATEFNQAAFLLKDGLHNLLFFGADALIIVDVQTIQITLFPLDPAGGGDVILNVGADNNIVAVDDGEPWAGVTDLELPFP